MSYIVVLVGPHLVGKTSYASSVMAVSTNFIRVSKIDIVHSAILEQVGGMAFKAFKDYINAVYINQIILAIANGLNVLADDCNLTATELQVFSDNFKPLVDSMTFHPFQADLVTLNARNRDRRKNGLRSYPDSLLQKQVQDFNNIKQIIPTSTANLFKKNWVM